MQHPFATWSLAHGILALSLGLAPPCAECDRGREGTRSLRVAHVQRSSVLLGGRHHAAHQVSMLDEAGVDVEAATGNATQPQDMIKVITRAANDTAWQAAGLATTARAAVADLRAKTARAGAGRSAVSSIITGQMSASLPSQIKDAEEQAQKSLNDALAHEAEVKRVVADVEKQAYDAARASADKEVAKLESEASKYYSSLEAKFKAVATSDKKTAADAAAKAAQPYVDVELGVSAAVLRYNTKAVQMIAQAKGLIQQAFTLANVARGEQASGDAVMAQRHMMQAHMWIGTAAKMKTDAYKLRKLAESLNMSIPSYQQASQMASIHALATFSGVQVDAHAIPRNVHQQAEEASRQVALGLADLTSELERASRELPKMSS